MNIETIIFAIIAVGAFIAAALLDIQSTAKNNGVPGLYGDIQQSKLMLLN